MKYPLLLSLVAVLAAGCTGKPAETPDVQSADKRSDEFYHYSTWTALVNKVFDGNLTAAEAKTKGDIGLGTYNGVDGELIMMNGILYHVPSSGEVRLVDDSMRIPYLNATFFDNEFSFELNDRINYDSLRKLLQQHFPSRNYFYAFSIHGEFDSLKLGSLYKQQKPYPEGLDSLMPKRPKFNHTSIAGTMVGFYCPDFIGDINVAGFHLHFLSDDKKKGGHVMEFAGKNFKVGMDKLSSCHFVLPDTEDYEKVNLEKRFQYGKK